jgi:hypothetical protein
MKPITEMNKFEITAHVQSRLLEKGIRVVLSGGAAVSYYCDNAYVSYDVDLVIELMASRIKIDEVMVDLGFSQAGKSYTLPGTDYFVEFPPGPLTVGVEPVKEVVEVAFTTGVLRIISATDSVKDRLAAYYHWGDEPCLQQARLIKKHCKVDLKEIERWSKGEGKEKEFQLFMEGKAK